MSGQAEFSEIDLFRISFDLVPACFEVIEGQFGSELKCRSCNVPVM
jgi:hypothetical protein